MLKIFLVILSDGKENGVKIVVMSEGDNELKSRDIENELRLPQNERSNSLDPTNKFDGFDPNRRRISSISSLGNWAGAMIVSDVAVSRNGNWYIGFYASQYQMLRIYITLQAKSGRFS